jgi:hypothetical protein
MIDIPIGLPDRGYRQCDIEARALVGTRVFLGARWVYGILKRSPRRTPPIGQRAIKAYHAALLH